MNSKVMFSSASDHWSTPKHVYDALNAEFHFDDDPCPLHGENGLDRDWGKSVFINPPYSDIITWIAKAYEHAQKGNMCVLLLPSRTDTKWWHEYAMKAQEIRFLRGRLKFGDAKNSAPFPSCLVIYK